MAAGYAFVYLWETARHETIPDAPSSAAARTVAVAVVERWGPSYRALAPADQERTYETLVGSTTLLSALSQQFQEAGWPEAAAPLRRAAAEAFESLFGASPAGVSVDADGRISGLAPDPTGAAPTTARPAPTPAASGSAAGPLPVGSAGGVQLFIKYTTWYDAVSMFNRDDQETLALFPDGTAVQGYPSEPVAAFTPAAIRAASGPDVRAGHVGTWRMAGDRLKLTVGGETRRLPRTDKGWYDSDEPRDPDGPTWDTYVPVTVTTPEQVLGPWENESVYVSGTVGGATGMTAVGGSGARVYYADGTFSEDRESFASATDSNVGDAYRAGDGSFGSYSTNTAAAGRWRLDGAVMTVEQDGVRTVVPAFIMPEWSATDTDLWIGRERRERPDPDE